jgi:glycosyltransferase involved in cell wall biosynthesis
VNERVVDWIWERQEWSLDRACARWMHRDDVDGFVGVEHGALAALGAARRAGKPGIVTFMSPHHSAFERWVEPEYATFPELDTEARRALSTLAVARDARRDSEARVADWIVTGSSFTTKSLIDAGVDAGKILTVPLAGPPAVDESRLPRTQPGITKVIYVGPVSVRKGAHYLLSAWKTIAPKNVELHCYGKMLLPEHVWRAAKNGPGGDSITFHGSIPARELASVYLNASVLVLPTLCDGYGLVVSEALSHGLPVITTSNAGSADAVDEGKTGFIIPPADDDALTMALQWCVDNPDALFEMRRPALAAARLRTWKEFRRLFISQLERAMRQASSASPSSSTGSARA